MAGKLNGKVAIVTASTDGIGLAIAKRLAKDGASVVISSRKQTNVDKAVAEVTSEGGKAFGLVCHVSKKEHRAQLINETLSRFGGIDILVSNAASNPTFGPIMDTSEEAWDKIFDTNVKASFFLCKEVIPHIEKRGGGSIVFVSSVAAFSPGDMNGAYSVSKTALIGLTNAMVNQCAGMDIRVNGIAPGLIKTRFSRALWQNESIKQKRLSRIPMGRLGNPDECAGAVSFLVSDDASYISGETIIMSGGSNPRL